MEETTVGIRKLTAILSSDAHGYSRLMSSDEESTVMRLTAYREIIFRIIRENRGRVANTAGDAVLAEFASAKDAVRGAIQIQQALAEQNAIVPLDSQMNFRIGIHLGDVYEQQGDLFGDGVNIAARIQSLAEPGGILMSASVFDQLEHKSNIPVEFAGEQKVKNIEKPVRVYRVAGRTPKAPLIATPPQELPDDAPPSIVVGVLPFDNLSEDPEQGYFCDGLTEDLTTALAAIPQIRVVARNTMSGFKGKALDIRQLGRDLEVTHIIEGSVRKAGNRIRANAQLLETKKGNHLWAQRYDMELSDLFDIQDDIVRSIATELDVQLVGGEAARVWRATTKNVEAYDLYMRALSASSVFAPQSLDRALALLERALQLDPDFVMAYCFKALFQLWQARHGMKGSLSERMHEARLAIEKACQLNDQLPSVHGVLASFLQTEGKLDQARKEFEIAISLNPNMSGIVSGWGWICLQTKDYRNALSAARRANELAAFPQQMNVELEALALQFLGRTEEAFAVVNRGLRRQPGDLLHWVTYAVIAMKLDLKDEVSQACSRVLEIQPNFSAARYAADSAMFDPETAIQYAEMLHSMGLP